MQGSNNWAVGADHTADGRPLLAGDPHSFLADPSFLTLSHLNSADAGGTYDMAGFSFAGTAGIHLGHNRHIAWTATTNFADAVDEIQPIILEKVTVLAHEGPLPSLIDGDPAALMLAALDDALAYLTGRAEDLGVAEVAWSDLHVAAFDRDYVTYFDFGFGDDTVVPWGGDATSINVAECFFWDGFELADRCVGNHGAIFRAVASFDADGPPRYRYAWPFGHTGEASDWIDGTYAELPFKRDEVEARTVEVRMIEP